MDSKNLDLDFLNDQSDNDTDKYEYVEDIYLLFDETNCVKQIQYREQEFQFIPVIFSCVPNFLEKNNNRNNLYIRVRTQTIKHLIIVKEEICTLLTTFTKFNMIYTDILHIYGDTIINLLSTSCNKNDITGTLTNDIYITLSCLNNDYMEIQNFFQKIKYISEINLYKRYIIKIIKKYSFDFKIFDYFKIYDYLNICIFEIELDGLIYNIHFSARAHNCKYLECILPLYNICFDGKQFICLNDYSLMNLIDFVLYESVVYYPLEHIYSQYYRGNYVCSRKHFIKIHSLLIKYINMGIKFKNFKYGQCCLCKCLNTLVYKWCDIYCSNGANDTHYTCMECSFGKKNMLPLLPLLPLCRSTALSHENYSFCHKENFKDYLLKEFGNCDDSKSGYNEYELVRKFNFYNNFFI